MSTSTANTVRKKIGPRCLTLCSLTSLQPSDSDLGVDALHVQPVRTNRRPAYGYQWAVRDPVHPPRLRLAPHLAVLEVKDRLAGPAAKLTHMATGDSIGTGIFRWPLPQAETGLLARLSYERTIIVGVCCPSCVFVR